jgi:signal peptidase I
MKINRRLLKALSTAVAFVLMIIAWVILAPIQVGGQTAYVIVNGNSMEPRFHRGDLVILHQAADYQVGDIATYRHPTVGPVIHRIIAREGDAYVFKGDHNGWVDPYRPVQAEIIGKYWQDVPSAGKIIEQLRTPWVMALLAAAIGGVYLITWSGGKTWSQSRPRQGRRPVGEQPRSMKYLNHNKADGFFVLAALVLASLALAFFAFTRPLFVAVPNDISYQHTGQFSYTADAPPGVYATHTVQTGEPIFRQLINQANVNFDYRLLTDQPGDFSGTYRLIAVVSHSNGWQRTLELQPETAFNGRSFSAGGRLDLAAVQTMIDSVEQQTGLIRQPYTLAIIPEVTIQGTLAGQEWQDQFAPPLTFRLDELQMQIAGDTAGPGEISDPFKPVQTGHLSQSTQAANTILLLGWQLPVSSARWLAVAGLVMAVVGGVGLGWLLIKTGQSSQISRIESKYGPLLVAVRNSDWLESGGQMIEVAAMEDLARLAEREGSMILHLARGSSHDYFVQNGRVTYRYHHTDNPAEPAQESRP